MMECRLEPARPEHALLWHRWRSEARALPYNPYRACGLRELQARLAVSVDDLRNEHSDCARWFVRAAGTWVGTVNLHAINWVQGYAEIGYHIALSHTGRGHGGAAVKMMLTKVFTESSLVRLMAVIDSENVPARRLVERLGFTREGTLRAHYVIAGERRDQVLYALLKDDWSGGLNFEDAG